MFTAIIFGIALGNVIGVAVFYAAHHVWGDVR